MTASASPTVERFGHRIVVHALDTPFVAGDLIRAVHHGRQEGHTNFELDLTNVSRCFPNACTPIAGLLDYYRQACGIHFSPANAPDFVERCAMLSPLEMLPAHPGNPTSVIWRFSSSADVNLLVNTLLDHLSRAVQCERGVLQGLEWCLNEVMDNVLQHASTAHGYAMGQIHRNSQHIAICIYDHGRGLFNSLRGSQHAPHTPLEAITMALREGVTRDSAVGQGNGLWGLSQIVAANSGLLNVTSGPAFLGVHGQNTITSDRTPFLSHDNHCTTVDFQIDFDTPISLPDALGGYEPVNVRVENMEDSSGDVILRLADEPLGTGTREAGAATRNEVLNLMNQTNAPIVLDFTGLSVVASSFADELLGKLALSLDRTTFEHRIRLRGMNDTVTAVVNRSFAQRLRGAGDGFGSA